MMIRRVINIDGQMFGQTHRMIDCSNPRVGDSNYFSDTEIEWCGDAMNLVERHRVVPDDHRMLIVIMMPGDASV